jgi:hypothetical protein
MRCRYALHHPVQIDPRCWLDPTLWDEARRSGYCDTAEGRVFYRDSGWASVYKVPPSLPQTVLEAPKGNSAAHGTAPVTPPVNVDLPTPELPLFITPPYYYRSLFGGAARNLVPFKIRWDGAGTSVFPLESNSLSRVLPREGAQLYECPTQARGGFALQRITLPPLKHRSVLSYMVNYHAERV